MLFIYRYKRLGADALIDRLIGRNNHLLAIRIAEYLQLRTDKILIHWACEKVNIMKCIMNHKIYIHTTY